MPEYINKIIDDEIARRQDERELARFVSGE